jgi:uncharacterized membrane protein YtjA (UPF0391 family)
LGSIGYGTVPAKERNGGARWVRPAKEDIVLYYALVFLIVGVIASVLGASGVAAVASQIAWVLFVIGIVLLIVHIVQGRRLPMP